MLSALSIKNYALIDELQVSFNDGFSIITGETGAGKSILLGGLSLVLGKRADLSQIKDSTKKCIIEAVFNIANYDLKPVFDASDLDYEPQTIIRREILPSGKSRAFVNDTPVNLENLSTLSSHLLDIHSQHQTLQLVNDNYQFMVIDALANNSALISSYKSDLKDYKALQKQKEQLESNRVEAKREYDYNLFLLKELEEAQLEVGQLQNLEESYEQLSNIESIQDAINQSRGLLNVEGIGVMDRLNEIKKQLQNISGFSKTYKTIEERIASTIIELDDINAELENFSENLVLDPQELEHISSKLQVLNNLLHKHSVLEISDLLKIKDELELKINNAENLDTEIEAVEKQIETVEKRLVKTADAIHKKRKSVISGFVANLQKILSGLGMPNAKFKIELERSANFLPNGMDKLEFLFLANKGGNFTALKKSASGGELSRIMLAIKSILANYIKLPTIMFDEIDTGVSGEISNKMADIMKTMSKQMQVFSITHLPQIASKGHWHYKVFKEDTNNVTQTKMILLSQEQRIVELAQMLGGTDITESAIAHAKQLLN